MAFFAWVLDGFFRLLAEALPTMRRSVADELLVVECDRVLDDRRE